MRKAAWAFLSLFALLAVAGVLFFNGYKFPINPVTDVRIDSVRVSEFETASGTELPIIRFVFSTTVDLQRRAVERREGTIIRATLCTDGAWDEKRLIDESVIFDRLDLINLHRGEQGASSVTGYSRLDSDPPGSRIPYSFWTRLTWEAHISGYTKMSAYDFRASPQDVCLQLRGGGLWVRYYSNVVVVPKAMIADAVRRAQLGPAEKPAIETRPAISEAPPFSKAVPAVP